MAVMTSTRNWPRNFTCLCVGLLVALGLVGSTGAQPEARRKDDIPLRITAARLEADQKDRVITFSGQVKAEYGDAVLYADRLQIYYQTSGEQQPAGEKGRAEASPLAGLGGEKIDRLVARGKVRFVQQDKVASGEEAVYYKDQDEVVLRGNPQLWRGESHLQGEKITFNLKHNRVQVDSSPKKRVEAFLYSQKTARHQAVPALLPGGGKSRSR